MARFFHYVVLVGSVFWCSPLSAQEVRCEVASQTGYSLNYRDRPALHGDVLGSLRNGRELLFDAPQDLATDDDGRLWAYVYAWEQDGWYGYGWVSKAYLKCNDGSVARRAIAMAYCQADSIVSIGKGFASYRTLADNAVAAGAEAIQNCVAGGARPGCCQIVHTAGRENGCIALSQSEFSFGSGEGRSWQEAVAMAEADCGDAGCRTLASSCIND